eukprot:6178269-Pyramimonas_sp.AAC.1
MGKRGRMSGGGRRLADDLDRMDSDLESSVPPSIARHSRTGMVGEHMRQGGDPDGRTCIICGVCDTDNDPVDLEFDVAQPMSWRRPATPDGKQEGRGCYYCFA